jgi:hypothetical protein
LIFSSNSGCVTSSRAKFTPACIDCVRGSVCSGRYRPDRCEPVCAIARDTSEDSAGIKSPTGDNVGDPQHERDAVGRTRTERHYYSANLPGGHRSFPGGKNISPACSLSFALFPATRDQGRLARESKHSLGTKRRGKMEIAWCAKKRSAGGFGKFASKYPRAASASGTGRTGGASRCRRTASPASIPTSSNRR